MADAHSMAEYRDIPGFPGYRVGSDGSVWTCLTRRRHTDTDGRPSGCRFVPGPVWKQLKFRIDRDGYAVVKPRRQTRRVHRLVLLAFVGPCPPGMEACHRDGCRLNNRLDNLRWDTRQANEADRIRHGMVLAGERHGSARLTEAEVRAIRAEYARGGITQREIGERYGVNQRTVSLIIRRRLWRNTA